MKTGQSSWPAKFRPKAGASAADPGNFVGNILLLLLPLRFGAQYVTSGKGGRLDAGHQAS